jgi:hypothetical protein
MEDKPTVPKLTVIEGGVSIRERKEKERKAFEEHYFRQVFENTKHLFTKDKENDK